MVPQKDRVKLLQRVNAHLTKEKIPLVDKFTLAWRMSRFFADKSKQKAKGSASGPLRPGNAKREEMRRK